MPTRRLEDGSPAKPYAHPAIKAGIILSEIASAARERLFLPDLFETTGRLGTGDDEMREAPGVLGANPGRRDGAGPKTFKAAEFC